MTEHEGDQPDPLLVRPFVLHDTGVVDDAPSTQTWPSATREVRSHRVLVGAPLTGRPKPAPKSPYPRRFLIVTAAGIAALAAVTVAGYAALGHGSRSSLADAPQRPPLPVVTGPRISASPSPSPSTVPPSTGAPRQAAVPPAPPRSHPAANATSAASRTSPQSSEPTAVRTSTLATPSPATPAKTAPPAGLAPALDRDRTGVIGGLNNLCLDLNGGVAVDDNHVQVFECNGSGAQRWTLATDGTLRVSGKCALVVGDGTVHIVGCDGRTTAQWRVAGRALINASDARCLTDPSDGTRSGAGVTVTPCTGSAEQSWNLP
jgi:ricin-type beta-trefoil lectin protein